MIRMHSRNLVVLNIRLLSSFHNSAIKYIISHKLSLKYHTTLIALTAFGYGYDDQ